METAKFPSGKGALGQSLRQAADFLVIAYRARAATLNSGGSSMGFLTAHW
jgi:hypothetical protein